MHVDSQTSAMPTHTGQPTRTPGVQVPFLFKYTIDALADPVTHETAVGIAAAVPVTLLIAYGAARMGTSLMSELRNAVFAKVAQGTVRQVSTRVRGPYPSETLPNGVLHALLLASVAPNRVRQGRSGSRAPGVDSSAQSPSLGDAPQGVAVQVALVIAEPCMLDASLLPRSLSGIRLIFILGSSPPKECLSGWALAEPESLPSFQGLIYNEYRLRAGVCSQASKHTHGLDLACHLGCAVGSRSRVIDRSTHTLHSDHVTDMLTHASSCAVHRCTH